MRRTLQVAATVLALGAAIALAVLWRRGPWSRSWLEWMEPTPQRLRVGSTGGMLGFTVEDRFFSSAEFMLLEPYPYYHDEPLPTKLGFLAWKDESSYGFFAPFWALILAALAAAVAPWRRWQFSLRTALVVTTLVALALGFVAAT